MRTIVVIAHNIRSCYNVGSLLRTADALKVGTVFLTGYTPYPSSHNDDRPPHIAAKLNNEIHKTALGAESSVAWRHVDDIFEVINQLHQKNYLIIALEQVPRAIQLPDFKPSAKVAIIIGREVEGIEPEVIDKASYAIEIPMLGKKESLNVIQAAAMALYHIRFC